MTDKGDVMLLLERARKRKKQVEKEIDARKREIRNLPPGRLECHKRVGGYRWYVVKNGKREYLKKCDISLAERLAYKRRLRDDLDNLQNERIALDAYIKISEYINREIDGSNEKTGNIMDVIGNGRKNSLVKIEKIVNVNKSIHKKNEEIDRLADNFWNKMHSDIVAWDVAEYEHRTDSDNAHKIRAKSGRYHESKDEVIIDNALFDKGLKIRYEPRLELGDEVIYPDFQILNPKTMKPILWEHFGMMDNPYYLRHNMWKLRKYIENGYYPGVNFIATFMGGDYRIDSQYVETLIEFYFE